MHNSAIFETPAPPPGILLADYFVQGAHFYGYRPSGTRDWLITYTHAGRGRFRLHDFTLQSNPGELVLLAPGTPHDYATSANSWCFSWAHFLPRPHWSPWLLTLPQPQSGLYTLTITDHTLKQRLENAWLQLLSDSRTNKALHEDLALNALEQILILAARQQSQDTSTPLDARVTTILDYLAHHLERPLSIPELARMVSLSPSRLAHLFKAQVGDSLTATHLKLRLRYAARLLEFTNQQINEISRLTGFQSPFHFSRQFKAHYGTNPSDFRAQASQSYAKQEAHQPFADMPLLE